MGTESKLVQVSRDNITYETLPGSTAEISQEGSQLDNNIFGSNFSSSFPGIINWSISGNALMRNQAGYNVALKEAGAPLVFTGEAMTLESGKTYFITDRVKSLWSTATVPSVSDNGVAVVSSNIKEIDYLQGRITFVDSYTVTGPVTVDGEYRPTTEFGNASSLTLTQSADTIESGSFETVKSNGGFQLFEATLLTVSLELESFFKTSSNFWQILKDRTDLIVEIDLNNDTLSVARGFFKVVSDSQSGDVGGDETESVSLELSVEDGVIPFSWFFDTASTVPEGAKIILENWISRDPVYIRYLPTGAGNRGFEGKTVVTDASIASSVSDAVEITFEGQGTDALNSINVV